jgi:hypothetical protein
VKNNGSWRIITFEGEKEYILLFDISMYYGISSTSAFKSRRLFFPYLSFLLKGLICIRRVSGVGDAKSPAMPEIWLSPGPFFKLSDIIQQALSYIYMYREVEELARKGRRGGTIIVMASWAHWILIVFPEQKLMYVYNKKRPRDVEKKIFRVRFIFLWNFVIVNRPGNKSI